MTAAVESLDFDTIVVGAGISGINAGYRLQDGIPGHNYTILESRGGIGGTWDFFKYPGIRSDSDLQTFGFAWRPWEADKSIADGASIVKYVKESAAMYGIDKKVRFHHKMLSANWSTEQQKWCLDVEANGKVSKYYANFIIMSTGYYDYNEPLQTVITGLENFKGTIVHPQFWPEDLDYTGKRMVIIGSGATSVTLLPILAQKAAHVTMLQRSPGYILNQPGTDNLGRICRFLHLPQSWTFALVRYKYLILPFLFFRFCRAYPNLARKILRARTTAELPKNINHDPHFSPKYNPWEERLCVAPDGDFYKALRDGNADIATSLITGMSNSTISLENGQKLDADIIVTATGLKMMFAGGSSITVDGNKPVNLGDRFLWKGTMIEGVPNCSFVLGYTNASWTLGADATALHTVRMIKYLKNNAYGSMTPTVPAGKVMKDVPVLNLRSTYVTKAVGVLPKAAEAAPWQPRSSYFTDIKEARTGDMTLDMTFAPIRA